MPKNQTPPPEHDEERKTVRIYVRCSAEVKRKLMTSAGGKGALSDFMLTRAQSNSQSNGRAERKGLIEALGQLGKIGSNVNQLAKAFNSGHSVPVASIEMALQEIADCGRAIMKELTKNDRP